MRNEIVIHDKNGWFAQLPSYVSSDLRLTSLAVRVLIYIKGKPSNWVARRSDIMNNLEISKSTMDRTLTNLVETGYLNRRKYRKDNNEWATEYDFFYDPGDNPKYDGEMPKDYFYIRRGTQNKKNPIAGQQMGGDEQQRTSTQNIPQKTTEYKKKSKIDEKYKDDVSEFEFVD